MSTVHYRPTSTVKPRFKVDFGDRPIQLYIKSTLYIGSIYIT